MPNINFDNFLEVQNELDRVFPEAVPIDINDEYGRPLDRQQTLQEALDAQAELEQEHMENQRLMHDFQQAQERVDIVPPIPRTRRTRRVVVPAQDEKYQPNEDKPEATYKPNFDEDDNNIETERTIAERNNPPEPEVPQPQNDDVPIFMANHTRRITRNRILGYGG